MGDSQQIRTTRESESENERVNNFQRVVKERLALREQLQKSRITGEMTTVARVQQF